MNVAQLPLIVIALAHAPLLVVYFQQLWDRPHYQFFPLVLGAAGFFIQNRWSQRHPPSQRAALLGSLLLPISMVILTYAFLRLSPMFAYVSFLLVLGAALLRLGVPALGPWMLLWLLVRIPYGQDVALIQWMQRLTTQLSSTVLDTIGIEHITDGNVLLFPTTSLFVEEACSGVVSLLAIVACAGILAVWWRRSIIHSLLLVAVGIFIAGAMNVIRVGTIAIALDSFDINLTEGWRHEALGLFIFAISLLALFSTDRLLLFLLGPIEASPLANYWDYAEGNILVQSWNQYVGLDQIDVEEDIDSDEPVRAIEFPKPHPSRILWDWAFAGLFLAIGAGQFLAGIGPFSVAPDISTVAMQLDEDSVPPTVNGWRRVGFENIERDSSSAFGEHSKIWAFQNGTVMVRVSVDFVFPEWHALTACYQGVGWTLEQTSLQQEEGGTAYVQGKFTKPDGATALLMFDLFDDDGRPYEAPSGTFVHPKLRRIFGGQGTRWTLPNYYQVQILSVAELAPLTEDEQESVRELFLWFRRYMIETVGRSSVSPTNVPPT